VRTRTQGVGYPFGLRGQGLAYDVAMSTLVTVLLTLQAEWPVLMALHRLRRRIRPEAKEDSGTPRSASPPEGHDRRG
jgi:hypothetical protein